MLVLSRFFEMCLFFCASFLYHKTLCLERNDFYTLCTAKDTDLHFSNLVQHYAYGNACHSNCIVRIPGSPSLAA